MRILVVSNYYPPHFIGGYELGCRDIVDLLHQRGHDILVLTGMYGVSAPTDESVEPGVRRQFRLEGEVPPFHPSRYLGEAANRRSFRCALADFRPELIYFWNQSHLPGSLVRLAREARVPYVFYLSDHAFLSWWTDSLWRRWIFPESTQPLKAAVKSMAKSLLPLLPLLEAHPQLDYRPRQFTSAFLQRLSPAASADELDRVIPWGVDLARFSYRSSGNARPTRLLYVGQIERHKGTLTALRAVSLLRERFEMNDVLLTIVGSGIHPDYLAEVREFAASEPLDGKIRFTGKLDRGLLPALYQEHDILIFPSEWEEPFAITPLEAMASGLVVVGTSTGGSREIFEHRQTAMVFSPGDADGCAAAIRSLLDDPALYQALRSAGRRLVEEKYSLAHMVDVIEEHLRMVLSRPPSRVPALP